MISHFWVIFHHEVHSGRHVLRHFQEIVIEIMVRPLAVVRGKRRGRIFRGLVMSGIRTGETGICEFTRVGGRTLRAAGREVLFEIQGIVERWIIGRGGTSLGQICIHAISVQEPGFGRAKGDVA